MSYFKDHASSLSKSFEVSNLLKPSKDFNSNQKPVKPSFNYPQILGMMTNQSTEGLSNMGMLLSSLQKQQKLDTHQKEIQ